MNVCVFCMRACVRVRVRSAGEQASCGELRAVYQLFGLSGLRRPSLWLVCPLQHVSGLTFPWLPCASMSWKIEEKNTKLDSSAFIERLSDKRKENIERLCLHMFVCVCVCSQEASLTLL